MKIKCIDDIISIRTFSKEMVLFTEHEMTFDQAINSLENYIFHLMNEDYHFRPEVLRLHNSVKYFCEDIIKNNSHLLDDSYKEYIGQLLSYANSMVDEYGAVSDIEEKRSSGRSNTFPQIKFYLYSALNASKREFEDYEAFRIFYNHFLDNKFNYENKKHLFPEYIFYEDANLGYFPAIPRIKPETTDWARSLKQNLTIGIEDIIEMTKNNGKDLLNQIILNNQNEE